MNIVSLEGRLQELLYIKKSLNNIGDNHKYDVSIYRISMKLKALTSEHYSKDVLNEMLYKSELIG